MGEAIGHEMMNHLGQRIIVSAKTLEALNMRGYLKRDHESGLLRLCMRSWYVFVEAERATSHYYELGSDCSGPNSVKCNCQKCKDKIEPDQANITDIRTRQMVHDLKARRRCA